MVWFGFPWWEYHEAFFREMRLFVFCFLCTLTVQVLFTVTWGLSFSYFQTKIGVSPPSLLFGLKCFYTCMYTFWGSV